MRAVLAELALRTQSISTAGQAALVITPALAVVAAVVAELHLLAGQAEMHPALLTVLAEPLLAVEPVELEPIQMAVQAANLAAVRAAAGRQAVLVELVK